MRLCRLFKWIVAAMVAMAALLHMGALEANAAPSVHLRAPAHDPSCRILRQFLEDRGFSLTQRRQGRQLLLVEVRALWKVRLVYLQHQRSYVLPKELQAPRTRARAMMSMIDVFLEEARSKRTAQQKRATTAPPRRRVRGKQPKRSAVPTTTSRVVAPPQPKKPSLRVVPSPRRVPAPPRAVAIASRTLPPKKGALERQPSQPRVTARALVRRSPATPRSLRPIPVSPAKKRPAPRKVAKSVVAARRVVPPQRSFFGVVGAAGSLRWAGRWEASWGGTLTAGLLLSNFALRVELSMLSFWLEQQEDTILLFRPALLAGWRIPLQRWTSRFELYLLGGVVVDPIVVEQLTNTRLMYHVGLTYAVEGHWRVTPHFSCFVRYSGAGFWLAYEPDEEGQDRKVYPTVWQQTLRVGVQARF